MAKATRRPRQPNPNAERPGPAQERTSGIRVQDWVQHQLFKPVPGHSLAAFRLIFGTYFLVYLLSFAPRLYVSFASGGLTVPYGIPDWALPPLACTLVFTAMILANVAFALGYRTRVSGSFLLVSYLYFYLLNIAVKNTSHERLNIILLTILCIAPTDRAWALTPGSGSPEYPRGMIPIWPIRLITLQVAFLYFGAGLWKFCNPLWHDGNLLYHNFIGDWATPLAFWTGRHIPNGPLWTLASWAVFAWELAMPFALISDRFRVHAVVSGTLFHLAVLATLGIPEFLNCITAYVLFFPPLLVRETGNRYLLRLADQIRRATLSAVD